MRIGIDCTAIPAEPVGAGKYIIELVRALVSLDSGDEWVLFVQPKGRELIGLPASLRLQYILTAENRPAWRLLGEQLVLPVLVKRAGVDLLHSPHYTRPFILPCASVITFHDMTFFLFPELHTRVKRLFFQNAIRLSASKADALIAVSESTRRDAIRLLGISPHKIYSTPLGVSERYRLISDEVVLEKARLRYKLPAKYLLYVGTIEPRKNLPLLIRSYYRFLDQGNALPLVVVGRKGWMFDDTFQLIEELGLKDKVFFAGYISEEDMPLVYNLAQAFVYPSLYEGFGLPPLEAMACGVPVITTAISAMRDHVAGAGILVPPNDEQALAQAIHMLIQDSSVREKLSIEGQTRAAQFTWKRTAQETLKAYQSIQVK